jgi:hypothetical protein
MLLIGETEQKIVTSRWAINKNQAVTMPGIKIKKISSRFLNKHFIDLLDDKDKATQPITIIYLLSSEDEGEVEMNYDKEISSLISSNRDDDDAN